MILLIPPPLKSWKEDSNLFPSVDEGWGFIWRDIAPIAPMEIARRNGHQIRKRRRLFDRFPLAHTHTHGKTNRKIIRPKDAVRDPLRNKHHIKIAAIKEKVSFFQKPCKRIIFKTVSGKIRYSVNAKLFASYPKPETLLILAKKGTFKKSMST